MKAQLDKAKEYLRDFSRSAKFSITSSWQVARGIFIAKVFLYVGQGLLPLGVAYLSGLLIDSVVGYLGSEPVTQSYIFGLLGLAALVQLVYSQSLRLEYYLGEKFYLAYAPFIEARLHAKFAQLDHNFYEDANFSKQVNKVRENLRLIYRYTDELIGLLSAVVQIVASGIAILLLNPWLALIISVGLIPSLKVQLRAARERWRIWDTIDQEWRLRMDIRNTILSPTQISELKIFGLPKYFNDLWQRFFNRSEQQRLKIEKQARDSQFLASIAESFIQMGAMAWLIVKVLQRAISVGQLEFYRRVIGDFSNASSRLIYGLQTVSETNLYLIDYLDVMETQPIVRQVPRPIRLRSTQIPKIEFKNVSFRYPKTKKYTLQNLSLVIEPGEDIALVGENGAGKSTIIKLLMRFYDVSKGDILINGHNIKDISLPDWYQQVGALFQEFNYYNYFKARRSIGVGNYKKLANISAIKQAAKSAGIDKKLEKLPDGYETVLSKVYKEGTSLSGGEWQRVALARTFFRNANILVLDEPTAAIDAKGEYEIFKKIAVTQKQKTTIIVSHRFSTVRNANKIYVIENGRISESGSHNELLKQKGTYSEMFELQAQGYR